jgi:hypothetical protein
MRTPDAVGTWNMEGTSIEEVAGEEVGGYNWARIEDSP